MFCARCGEQIPDDSRFCQICGREATLKLDSAPSPAPAAPGPPYAFVTIPQNFGPSGVGGWLLFYCLGTIIGGMIALSRMHDPWQLQNPIYLLAQIRLLYGAVVGVFLWMKRPIALLLLRIYFIIVAAYFLATILRLSSLALASHASLFSVPAYSSTVLALGVAIAWFAYFRSSQRVRNTYGANI